MTEVTPPGAAPKRPEISFEFFPPNTPEGQEKLRVTTRELAQLNPKFFSVTFGAGGSTRDRTLGTVLDIRELGYEAAPHISCVASTKASIREWVQRYKENGIKHLVALRGDLPSGLAAATLEKVASPATPPAARLSTMI